MDRAWEVIRELNKQGFKVEVVQTETHVFCTVYDSGGNVIAEAKAEPYKVPYAICLAALETVEVKVS